MGDYLRCNLNPKLPTIYKLYCFFEKTDFSNDKMRLVYAIFAPATYFYIFMLFFLYNIINKNKTFLIIYIFAIVYWCTFLLGPVVMVRYTTYLYAMIPAHISSLFYKKK